MFLIAGAKGADVFGPIQQRLSEQWAGAYKNSQIAVGEHLLPIAEKVYAVPAWQWAIISGLLLFTLLTSWRLSKVKKPDAPLISPLVSCGGFVFFAAGVAASGLIVAFATVFAGAFYFMEWGEPLREHFTQHAIALAVGSLVGSAMSAPLALRFIPLWERGAGLPDVKETVRTFKRLNGFDPRRCIRLRRGCFVGKDLAGRPIFIPWAKLHETHVQVLGTTGCGKGMVLSLIACQCALAGEAVIWFDPKGDRFAPRIMRQAAEAAGRPFVLLNLNAEQPPQFNLLAGAKPHEITDLFVAGFDLRGKGTDGDFHRARDEDAAMQAAALAKAKGPRSIAELVHACEDDEFIVGQEHFWRCLRKLANLSVCQTDGGIDLAAAIEEGAVVYIIGSADSESVKMLQKMLLLRVVQLIKARDRSEEQRQVCVVLDEFKHLLSPITNTALGTVRDFGSHFFLAHQSLGDLASCPGISRADAYGSVVDNTAIKIIYRINDGEHAERIASTAGRQRTFAETSSKNANETSAPGGWREALTHYLNPDLLTHLPMPSDRRGQASVGALLGLGNAKLFYLGPIHVSAPMPNPVAVPQSPDTPQPSDAVGLI